MNILAYVFLAATLLLIVLFFLSIFEEGTSL